MTAASPTPRPAHRILVVDDEVRGVELLERSLRKLGKVVKASSGEEGWARAQESEFDLVVSDQRMPDLSGVELLARVAARNEHCGRILVTGYADLNATVDAINRGRVHAYVHKPYHPDELHVSVVGVLDRMALARDNTRLLGEVCRQNAALEEMVVSLQATRDRLVEAERLSAIGRMIAMIVHDFRGPLTTLRSSCQEIESEAARLSPSELRTLAGSALGDTQRMVRMCQELLDATRGIHASPERTIEEIDALIESTLASVCETAARSAIRIETALHSRTRTRVDEAGLRRALCNLMFNAIEAMPDGGVLRIQSETRGVEVCITVSDTGTGVSDEIRDRLFQPFVTHGKANGTGLGLAVVKKVASDHGGRIEVGKAEGGGARFDLWLPVHPAASNA